MKIRVPKEIKLLSHKYKIRFNCKELLSAGTSGLTRHLHQEIILDKQNTPPSELSQIFLHEFIHVIERRFCLKLDDADVERISEGINTLLVDNLGIELDWSDIKEGE